MWKCRIHPNFAETELLSKFLLNENSIDYDDSLKLDEVAIVRYDETGCYIKRQFWNDILSYFETYTINTWINNYDYYYLRSALKDWDKNNYDTLVVGSSYACFGYNEKMTNGHAKNLALPSQDLYYASKLIEKCSKRKLPIKNIVIGLGYYTFYSDLSKTENEDELSRISNVYYPIFEDTHNACILPPKMQVECSIVWDIQNIMEYFSNQIYSAICGNYFSNIHDRKKFKTVMWNDSFKDWIELSPGERETAGKKRAQIHNRSINYKESYAENILILNELTDWCEKENITLYICVYPTSKEYSVYQNKQIIDDFWDALSQVKGKIHVLDLNTCGIFGTEDFNDMDHLSACGAEKATVLINEVIGIFE